MCNISRSGIEVDPRMSHYADVEGFTHKHVGDIGATSSYYYSFNTFKIQELVIFYSVLVRDGVLGSSNGTLHRRWLQGSNFDKTTYKSMNSSR